MIEELKYPLSNDFEKKQKTTWRQRRAWKKARRSSIGIVVNFIGFLVLVIFAISYEIYDYLPELISYAERYRPFIASEMP